MRRLAFAVMLATGWRRRAIAALAGACGALALAPVLLFPATLVPMMVAVWLIDGSSGDKTEPGSRLRAWLAPVLNAAELGWWLGFGYFVAGLWWLGAAFLVDAQEFAWALPFGVLGLPAYLALYTAAGFALARALWSASPWRVLALAFGIGVGEWARGLLLTGFPWNGWGMALGGVLPLAQAASLVGLYGLNVLTVAIFAAPATLIDAPRGRWLASPAGAAALTFALIAGFGFVRLSGGAVDAQPGVKLRIMQPNLELGERFSADNKDEIVSRYLSLSDQATSPETTGVANVTHLIWPESAFPFILARDRTELTRIGDFLKSGAILITGAARVETPPRGPRPVGESRAIYYNSMQVVGPGGVILDTYDKTHLVPFGEYLPFAPILESFGLRHFVHIPGGFDPGRSHSGLSAPALPLIAPIICYEAIFPGAVTAHDGTRPGLLVNVTNDGWFGRTAGPYQHFSQARLRSVEEGLPLVRSANTGISAIVDPYGRVLQSLPLGARGVLDGSLPTPAAATFFSLHPLVGPIALLLLALSGAVIARVYG